MLTIKKILIWNMQARILDFGFWILDFDRRERLENVLRFLGGFGGLFHVFEGYFRCWTSLKVKNIQPGPQMVIFVMVRF
jgi:hypothetical protein